jgi:hypothetical protein
MAFRLLAGMDSRVHVSRSTAVLDSRYSPPFVGRPLADALDAMVERGIVSTIHKGVHHGGQSVYAPGSELVRLVEYFGVTSADEFVLDPAEEVVIAAVAKSDPLYTRDGSNLLDYDDDAVPAAPVLRAWLRTYNAFIERADIACSLPYIDTRNRRLRQVFHDENLTTGGRHYGGFWQPMSGGARPNRKDKSRNFNERKTITIDGEPTVTIDYRATFVMLAYADVRRVLPDIVVPNGDAYDIGADVPRDIVKLLTLALLCCSSPLTRWPRRIREKIATDYPNLPLDLQSTISAIKARHPVLAWERGRGLELMRIEADVMTDVLNSCLQRDIVALPVFDALVVKEKHATDVAALMRAWFAGKTGVAVEVTMK